MKAKKAFRIGIILLIVLILLPIVTATFLIAFFPDSAATSCVALLLAGFFSHSDPIPRGDFLVTDYESWDYSKYDSSLCVKNHDTLGAIADLNEEEKYYQPSGIFQRNFLIKCQGGIGGCHDAVVRKKSCSDVPLFDYPLQNARITHGGKTLQLDEAKLAELIAYLKEIIVQKDYRPSYSWFESGMHYELLDFIVDFQESNELYYHGAIFFLKDENVAYFSFYLYNEEKDGYDDIHIPLSEEWVQKLQATFETK